MMSPPSFPITPRQLRGRWAFDGLEPGQISVGPLTLTALEIPHKGGRTFGYRVTDGRAAICYLTRPGSGAGQTASASTTTRRWS
jgi:hypothetical protein